MDERSAGSALVAPGTGRFHEWFHETDVLRHARQHATECHERLADLDAPVAYAGFPNCRFVVAAALLHHRARASQRAGMLEVPEQQHRVRQIADLSGLAGL